MVDSCGTTTPTSRTRHWCVAASQLPLIATLPWPWPRSGACGAHFKPCALRHSVLSKYIVLRYKSTTVWAHARRSGHPTEVHCAEMIMNRRPYVRSNANSRLRTRSSPARSTPARSARVAGRPHRDEPPEGEKRNPDHPIADRLRKVDMQIIAQPVPDRPRTSGRGRGLRDGAAARARSIRTHTTPWIGARRVPTEPPRTRSGRQPQEEIIRCSNESTTTPTARGSTTIRHGSRMTPRRDVRNSLGAKSRLCCSSRCS